jgi:hypothetical protein
MPRASDSGVGARFHLPDVYRKLLKAKCEFQTQPGPRGLLVDDDWREAYEEFEQAKAQGLRTAAALYEERLAAGEPFTVASWSVGAHGSLVAAGAPVWLTTPAIYGGAHTVRVFSDDTIEPAEDD